MVARREVPFKPRRLLVALACAAAILATATPPALAASGLVWGGRVLVDGPEGAHRLRAVSCNAQGFCAAVDDKGNAVTSAKPTGGAAAWKATNVDGTNVLLGVSCTTGLCVAVDASGNALALPNPLSAASSWTAPAAVDAGNALTGVSCPSASLCVAVDGIGHVVTSTHPTGPAAGWTAVSVDPGSTLEAVSCPSASFCAAVDNHGNALTSANPTGGAAAWKLHAHVDSSTSLGAVSCRSASLCVAVDDAGNVVSSTNPTGAAAWKTANVEGTTFNTLFGVSCPTVSLCVAADDGGNALTSSTPTGGPAAWARKQIDGRWGFYGVSCGTAALCVAADAGGNVVVGRVPVPDTRIVKATIRKAKHSATFGFKVIGTATGFECRLHKKNGPKGKFSRCASPKTYKGVPAGSYTFFVRALNAAGRDPSPAHAAFQM